MLLFFFLPAAEEAYLEDFYREECERERRMAEPAIPPQLVQNEGGGEGKSGCECGEAPNLLPLRFLEEALRPEGGASSSDEDSKDRRGGRNLRGEDEEGGVVSRSTPDCEMCACEGGGVDAVGGSTVPAFAPSVEELLARVKELESTIKRQAEETVAHPVVESPVLSVDEVLKGFTSSAGDFLRSSCRTEPVIVKLELVVKTGRTTKSYAVEEVCCDAPSVDSSGGGGGIDPDEVFTHAIEKGDVEAVQAVLTSPNHPSQEVVNEAFVKMVSDSECIVNGTRNWDFSEADERNLPIIYTMLKTPDVKIRPDQQTMINLLADVCMYRRTFAALAILFSLEFTQPFVLRNEQELEMLRSEFPDMPLTRILNLYLQNAAQSKS